MIATIIITIVFIGIIGLLFAPFSDGYTIMEKWENGIEAGLGCIGIIAKWLLFLVCGACVIGFIVVLTQIR